MNAKIKQKWLTALRSGKYKQGKKYLHPGDTYCCLGVLCDLYIRAKKTKWIKSPDAALEGDAHSFAGASRLIPSVIASWAGLATFDPSLGHETDPCICTNKRSETYCALSELNDDGKSFKQIANYIERSL